MSAEDLNIHFTSVADQVIQNDCSASNDLRLLRDFCTSKGIMSELTFPPITVVDVYHTSSHVKQTGTCYLEGLKSKTLNLLTSTTADIYNLTKAVFQKSSKSRKSSLHTSMLPKLTLLTIGRYQVFCYCENLLKNTYTHNRCILKHLNDTKLLHPNQSGFGRTLPARLHLPISLITGFTALTIINSMGSC